MSERHEPRQLSDASRHGLALTALQGFLPSSEFLDLLGQLDAGLISEETALAGALLIAREN